MMDTQKKWVSKKEHDHEPSNFGPPSLIDPTMGGAIIYLGCSLRWKHGCFAKGIQTYLNPHKLE